MFQITSSCGIILEREELQRTGLHFQETQHGFSVNEPFNTETVATEGCVDGNGAVGIVIGGGGIHHGTAATDAAINMVGQPETYSIATFMRVRCHRTNQD